MSVSLNNETLNFKMGDFFFIDLYVPSFFSPTTVLTSFLKYNKCNGILLSNSNFVNWSLPFLKCFILMNLFVVHIFKMCHMDLKLWSFNMPVHHNVVCTHQWVLNYTGSVTGGVTSATFFSIAVESFVLWFILGRSHVWLLT